MRRRALTTATVVLVALGLSPAAAPHGGGGAAKGYASTISSITPRTGDIEAAILDADDRLELRVRGDHVVVVEGYEGEPYLRFSPAGVERNRRSPATYLNDARYGTVKLPADADADAPPDWETIAPAGRAYDWHDHRIHWMSTSSPPVVIADKSTSHRIFDWSVPGTLDGKPFAVHGHLDYIPLPGQRFPRWLVIPLVALVLLAVALSLLRRRSPHRAADRLSPLTHDGKEPRS